ncbi:hypothetical protein [Serratia sp. Se-RSBMAAmG]|uniref:hypothetical protein n=1 Tax=Serratia sp. Se-RSBMAAmG TaxID=3043305 RepID=UPI0024AED4BD|nr:hypothetical protein [Serratia sp. Se-RSBMAAmG]MDI6976101.1 hypothetical protein [Serratia sp. Se-RSBMAAmG]
MLYDLTEFKNKIKEIVDSGSLYSSSFRQIEQLKELKVSMLNSEEQMRKAIENKGTELSGILLNEFNACLEANQACHDACSQSVLKHDCFLDECKAFIIKCDAFPDEVEPHVITDLMKEITTIISKREKEMEEMDLIISKSGDVALVHLSNFLNHLKAM